MVMSRFTDKTPVQCGDDSCGWRGTISECNHTYRAIPNTKGEVEGIDVCPKCGNDHLIEIAGEGALLVPCLA